MSLTVTHIAQAPGLCGAATAQMMLHFKGMAAATPAVQQQIFTEIQVRTQGMRPDGNIRDHDCLPWATQLCDRCQGDPRYTCWCSYPPALTATLHDRGLAVVETRYTDDDDAATVQVLDAIDCGFPPAVLVFNGQHWVAVTGYLTGSGPPDARYVGGRWVTDIMLNDPNLTQPSSVSIDKWFVEHLAPVVLCGPYVNTVVVISDALAPHTTTTPAPATTATTTAEDGPSRRRRRVRPERRRRPPRQPTPPGPGPRRSRAKR